MGLLDSNKVLPGAKSIKVENTTFQANKWLTEGGMVDVKNYKSAIIRIDATFESGVSMNVFALENTTLSSSSAIRSIFYNFTTGAATNVISTNGAYIVDLSRISYWGLYTQTAGTFNFEIALCSKEVNEKEYNKFDSVISGVNSIDNNYSATEGTFSLDGTVGEKLNLTLTKEYSTLCIDAIYSGDNGYLSVNKYSGNSLLCEQLPIIDNYGKLYDIITGTGSYYIDIRGVDRIKLRCELVNSSTGTVKYRLLKNPPVDYKAIQEIYTLSQTMDGGEVSKLMTLSTQTTILRYFKFIKAEISYTGSSTPSATISVAPYYGNSVYGAFKEKYTITGTPDSIDWFENPGTMIGIRFQFRGGFTPSQGDVLTVKLFGMR